jgi:hypothetical protein
MRVIAVAGCLAFAAAAVLPADGLAARRQVEADGSGPYATVQDAIDAAAPGDSVILGVGTYQGPGNRDLDFNGKAITVRCASDDSSRCVVDCQGSALDQHRGFWFHSLETAASVLERVTIRGGYVADHGGGILCEGVSDGTIAMPTIRHCRVTHCTAPDGAGLAYYRPSSKRLAPADAAVASLTACTADSNSGDGIYLAENQYALLARGCSFSDNSGSGATVGYRQTASPELEQLRFVSCRFCRNGEAGFQKTTLLSSVTIDSCLVSDNVGNGIRVYAADFESMSVSNSTISGNGGGIYQRSLTDVYLSVTNCTISGNHLFGIQAGVDDYTIGLDVVGCRIIDNDGDGILLASPAVKSLLAGKSSLFTVLIDGCDIRGNAGDGLALTGSVPFNFGRFGLTNTLLCDNVSAGVRFTPSGSVGYTRDARFENLTVAGNGAEGLCFATFFPDTLEAVIAAGNQGAGVSCVSGSVPWLSCSDLHGNLGGDWVGAIAGQNGLSGNFSADPLFCDAGSGDYGLRSDSPCLSGRHPDGAGCGQIGALGRSCFADWPVITEILDVGNDQGRQVRLKWLRSGYDAPGSAAPITGYALFRRQDLYKSRTAVPGRNVPEPTRLAGWDYLETVPPFGEEVNQCVVPTLCDSTSGGVCRATFLVRAMTADPYTFYDSPPDSGYSIDNLAPAAPVNLAVVGRLLTWSASPEADFGYYRVYGANHGGLAQATRLAQTTEGAFDTEGFGFLYYLVTATDLAGNESAAGSTLGAPTSVADAVPRTSLHPAVPNPFNPATVLRFDLVTAGPTSLRVYDLSGRLVCTLVRGRMMSAGTHDVVWKGRNDAGAPVAAGTYVVRMETGGIVRSRSLTLVK